MEGIEEYGSHYHQLCYQQAHQHTNLVELQPDDITSQLSIDDLVEDIVFGTPEEDVVLDNIPVEQLYASAAEQILNQQDNQLQKSDYEMDSSLSTYDPNCFSPSEFSAEQNGFINPHEIKQYQNLPYHTEVQYNHQYLPYQTHYNQYQSDAKPLLLQQHQSFYNPENELHYLTQEQHHQLALQQQVYYSNQQQQQMMRQLSFDYNSYMSPPHAKSGVFQVADIPQDVNTQVFQIADIPHNVKPQLFEIADIPQIAKPPLFEIVDLSQGQIVCNVTDQISAYRHKVNSSNEKRSRITISEEHKNILLEMFEKKTFPNAKERRQLAELTGMSPRRVQIWFQNMRSKEKKMNGIPVNKRQKKHSTAFYLEDANNFLL